MQYDNDYSPVKWQDEIVDSQSGDIIVPGTLYDENNMNRMEAGIDLLNTFNTFMAELARLIRSNFLEQDKWKNQRMQQGIVEITNPNTKTYFREADPFVIVPIPGYTQLDTPGYSVLTEVTEGDPARIGDIIVYDKSSNGFKLKYTGSAGNAKIRWTLVNPDV